MTIDRAIKVLEDDTYFCTIPYNQDFIDATKLGIEALKAWQEKRFLSKGSQTYLLLGETED